MSDCVGDWRDGEKSAVSGGIADEVGGGSLRCSSSSQCCFCRLDEGRSLGMRSMHGMTVSAVRKMRSRVVAKTVSSIMRVVEVLVLSMFPAMLIEGVGQGRTSCTNGDEGNRALHFVWRICSNVLVGG